MMRHVTMAPKPARVGDRRAFFALRPDLAHDDDTTGRALSDFGWAAERALRRLGSAVR
jgi:hypothetical protein